MPPARRPASPARTSTRAATARRRAVGPATPDATLDLVSDSLGYAIKRAQVRSYEMFFRQLGQDDLSPARMTALSLIATEQQINQATLGLRLKIRGPSVVKVVDALEALGLVRREPVEGDRRRYALALTPAGRRKLQQFQVKVAAYEQALAGGLSEVERRQLIDLLERVAQEPQETR
ncbi:MarR family winged helix-turn-helix transcriptional regulator [Aquabacterium sp. J223]|uniref:MarR family winged helix-turn-helix transcriptional regulator n=1 Tax=Aquabacterium sp. J223 TaxID=2898431 RepID=UPI0021ADC940|nr:MarR family transcriptional regulator [Aquabacterium sp. J223]UUX94505.1 MarR family transcriptional regulator [Aquabacterium sp. J223]